MCLVFKITRMTFSIVILAKLSMNLYWSNHFCLNPSSSVIVKTHTTINITNTFFSVKTISQNNLITWFIISNHMTIMWLTFLPKIWLIAADSFNVHSDTTCCRFSFINNIKAFKGFLICGFFLSGSGWLPWLLLLPSWPVLQNQ